LGVEATAGPYRKPFRDLPSHRPVCAACFFVSMLALPLLVMRSER
jgi:hypothetical protein